MTREQLKSDPAFASLTDKQQSFLTQVASGLDVMAAIRATYNYTGDNSPANVRRQKAKLMRKPSIRQFLAALGQPDPNLQELARRMAEAPSIRALDTARRSFKALARISPRDKAVLMTERAHEDAFEACNKDHDWEYEKLIMGHTRDLEIKQNRSSTLSSLAYLPTKAEVQIAIEQERPSAK